MSTLNISMEDYFKEDGYYLITWKIYFNLEYFNGVLI